MSFELTPEKLQSIAVKCAVQFLSKQASLSASISKEAQELGLNPDQIKRTIEATNTVTYLRQLEDSKDRTLEFPLADYKEVIAHMVMPEKQAEDESKESESTKEEDNEIKKEDRADPEKDKADSDVEKSASLFSQQEKIAMISKETLRCMQVMEKMAVDKAGLKLELDRAISLVKSDPLALEKIAHIAGENTDKLIKLCGLEKRAHQDLVFTNSELALTDHLHSLYKEAKILVTQEAEIKAFITKSRDVLSKEAGLGGWVAEKVGKGIGATIGGLTSAAAAPVKRMGSNYGKFSASASAKGMSTSEAAKSFDKMRATHGVEAAKAFHGGAAPNIIHRHGVLGTADIAGSAVTGLALTHNTNVWDTLQKNH